MGPWRAAHFSALRFKILVPGAKNGRQALRSHTPALSHPGEGVEPLASEFVLLSEKIDSLEVWEREQKEPRFLWLWIEKAQTRVLREDVDNDGFGRGARAVRGKARRGCFQLDAGA